MTMCDHGGVARAKQGTGGKSTGRDRGFVYKVGDRGQNIDEVNFDKIFVFLHNLENPVHGKPSLYRTSTETSQDEFQACPMKITKYCST